MEKAHPLAQYIATGVPFPQIGVFSFSAIVCDVEVDEATGKVTVNEAWSACDVTQFRNAFASIVTDAPGSGGSLISSSLSFGRSKKRSETARPALPVSIGIRNGIAIASAPHTMISRAIPAGLT